MARESIWIVAGNFFNYGGLCCDTMMRKFVAMDCRQKDSFATIREYSYLVCGIRSSTKQQIVTKNEIIDMYVGIA